RVRNLISASDFTQQRTDRPMRLEVDLKLSGKRFEYALSFEWPANFHEARILDESLSVEGQPIFTRHHSQIQLSGGGSFGLEWHAVDREIRAAESAAQSLGRVQGTLGWREVFLPQRVHRRVQHRGPARLLHVGRAGQPPFAFGSRPVRYRLAEDDQPERPIHR